MLFKKEVMEAKVKKFCEQTKHDLELITDIVINGNYKDEIENIILSCNAKTQISNGVIINRIKEIRDDHKKQIIIGSEKIELLKEVDELKKKNLEDAKLKEFEIKIKENIQIEYKEKLQETIINCQNDYIGRIKFHYIIIIIFLIITNIIMFSGIVNVNFHVNTSMCDPEYNGKFLTI